MAQQQPDGNAVLADAMQALAAAMTAQTRQQQRHVPPAGIPADSVKIPLYDGRTDVEDFIALFEHVSILYDWAPHLKTAKLKTSLQGTAMECGRPDAWRDIYAALRARFGISEAEAKRSLLAMKTGHHDKLRELADRIRKLTDLAYPTVAAGVRETLALDQFKRCVSPDISLFLVSRPPEDLDEAVAFCGEYVSANPRGRRMQLSAVDVCKSDGVEINAFEAPAVTKKELNSALSDFQKSMCGFMKEIMSSCADVRKGMQQTSEAETVPRKTGPELEQKAKQKKPLGPCFVCRGPHLMRVCPQRSGQNTQDSRKKPGNAQRPQQ